MIAERLRKAVLQAAIEGKITNRIYIEGEAKEVYSKFNDRNPEIKVENSFDIPSIWRWVKLEEISTIISKGTTPTGGKNSYVSMGVPFIRAENLGSNGEIIYDNISYIDKNTHQSLKRSQLIKNDLLISIAGTLGRSAVLDDKYTEVNTNQAVAFVRIENYDLFDIRYLQRCISAEKIQKELLSKTKVTAIPNLTLEIIRNTWIPVPPIEEQKRIVEKLEVLLAEIDKLEQDEKALKELEDKFPKKLKNAILQSAIEGKLASIQKSDVCSLSFLEQIKKTRFELVSKKENKNENEMGKIQSSEFIFDIPTNWNWIKLGDIASINTGVTFKKEEQSNNGIRILRGGSISNGQISIYDNDIFLPQEKVKTEHIVRKGDILTPSVTSIEHIGKVGIVKENSNKMAHGGFVFNIRPYLENYIFSKYIYYYIQSPKNIDKLRTLTNKSGQAFYNLGKEKFRNIVIPIPPINEQKHIVEELDKLFAIDLLNI